MIQPTRAQLEALTRVYAASNTASYLYRKLRQHPTVKHLAEDHDVDELADTIKEIDALDERDVFAVSLAYAAAVALTWHDPQTVEEAVADLVMQNLRWVRQLLECWRVETIPSNVSELRLPQVIQRRAQTPHGTEKKIIFPSGSR